MKRINMPGKQFTDLFILHLSLFIVSVGYYFKPVIAMYFREGQGPDLQASPSYKVHILFLTLLTILLGFLPFLLSGLI